MFFGVGCWTQDVCLSISVICVIYLWACFLLDCTPERCHWRCSKECHRSSNRAPLRRQLSLLPSWLSVEVGGVYLFLSLTSAVVGLQRSNRSMFIPVMSESRCCSAGGGVTTTCCPNIDGNTVVSQFCLWQTSVGKLKMLVVQTKKIVATSGQQLFNMFILKLY